MHMTVNSLDEIANALGMSMFQLMVIPAEGSLSALLEEIRQAFGDDIDRAVERIRRGLAEQREEQAARRDHVKRNKKKRVTRG